LFLGLTGVFVAYFLVWLPGPSAGLQLIGLEIGEWIKFLGVGGRRDIFYLPPITLGLTLALLAATWPNDRPQTWAMRALAVGVSLLAFPAIAAIQLEPVGEWLPRLMLIVAVAVVGGIGAVRVARVPTPYWPWLWMALIALFGALLPTVQYLTVRPVVGEILRRPIAIGLGVWLNFAGCLLVAIMSYMEYESARRNIKRQPSDGRLSNDSLGMQ
jgi:hypothetical protein